MLKPQKTILCVQRSEKGQDLAEYAILIGVIALAVVLAITVLGTNLSGVLSELASEIGAWF